MDKATFDQWCLVELFGHARIAGRVSEETIGGCAFVRVDVPTVDGIPGYTRLFGNGAIYSITPVTEEVACAAAKSYRAVPVSLYELRALRGQAALGLSDDERGGF
jgi:hypothetical protein